MDKNIIRVAQVGHVAKGVVYLLTGVLAVMAALDMGGEKAGKLQVLEFLEKQAFGKVILALLGLGLICYALWRFIQCFQDPENIGDDSKAWIKRISFGISGLVYLGLGIYAIVDIFRQSSSGGGGDSSSFLSGDMRKYVFLAIGIALGAKGIYQFIKAYKGDFLKQFNISSGNHAEKHKGIKFLGYAGLIARGIVVSIIAYFFIKGSLAYGGGQEAKGTAEAFSFIQNNTSSPWIFAIIAAGLAAYGIYMFAMARYREFG